LYPGAVIILDAVMDDVVIEEVAFIELTFKVE
jgi:hypothetical protein